MYDTGGVSTGKPTLLGPRGAFPFAARNAAVAGLISARAAAWTEGGLQAMFLTKFNISATVALVLTLAVTGVGLLIQPVRAEPRPDQAERDRARADARRGQGDARAAARPEVRGVLKAVDTNKGTLTVAVGDGRQEPEEKTFTVAKNAEVGVNVGVGRRSAFREAKLADLAPGALVALQLTQDQKTAEVILADGPSIHGSLKAVDAVKGTITVTTWTRTGRREEPPATEEKTYHLDKSGEIGVDDGRGKTSPSRR
jgi:hypothetical protein